MRQIKFRAWDKEKKLMKTSKKNQITFDGQLIPKGYGFYESDGGFILMQFTGLLDKNGKEIYEGDIVKCVVGAKEKEIIGKVIFQAFRASWSIEHSAYANNDIYRYIQNGNRAEVIGNIYENPELIKN